MEPEYLEKSIFLEKKALWDGFNYKTQYSAAIVSYQEVGKFFKICSTGWTFVVQSECQVNRFKKE